MTSRASRLALAVVVGLLICLGGYQPASAQPTTLTITINYNGGTCSQSSSDGQAGPVINVNQSSQTVTYQSATAVSTFQISFSSCPFSSCPVTSTNGSGVSAGQPNASAVGNTYNYSSVTFGSGANQQSCNNPGSMGVHIRNP